MVEYSHLQIRAERRTSGDKMPAIPARLGLLVGGAATRRGSRQEPKLGAIQGGRYLQKADKSKKEGNMP
jgi:hypothetical protein